MAYLNINGYAVKTQFGGEVSFEEVAGHRSYSFNGLYQFSRNSLARAWQFVTIPLPRDEAMALAAMINMQGDAWRWDLNAAAAGVVYVSDDTSPETWTDKRRVSQSAESKCTIVSAYGADGARVYDWNGNAYAPFSGCEGAVLVDPAATNMLSTNNAHPTANGHLSNFGAATHAATTSRYWTGSGCVKVTSTGADLDAVYTATHTVASGDYAAGNVLVFSVYLAPDAGGEAIELFFQEDTGGGLTTAGTPTTIVLPSALDTWTRYSVALTTSGSSVSVRAVISNDGITGAQDWYVDGLQLEVQAQGYPTAWISPGSDPWGSGNGVRPAGVLDYDTFVASYTKGFTFSTWFNHQYTPSGSRFLFRSGDSAPRLQIVLGSDDKISPSIVTSDGSILTVASSALSNGWNHIVVTYNPSDATMRLYINGSLSASDASWSARRQKWDVENTSGDLSLGSNGGAGSNVLAMPLGPTQIFPFAAPLNFITGLYNSGTDDQPVPGLMPLAVAGDALGTGEKSVLCYGQASLTNVPHKSSITGNWESGGATVTFSLLEATGR